MVDNRIQFAVVREDPEIEISILKNRTAKKVLLIGSGGCTAFSLQSAFPHLQITLFDTNSHQLELIKNKKEILEKNVTAELRSAFNVGTDAMSGLSQCGNFEYLFRCLRNFVYQFVAEEKVWTNLFEHKKGRTELLEGLGSNKYWKVAFELFFSDTMLEALFTKAATQHAPPGSYPKYFQRIFENALVSDSVYQNYFMHHIFLGYYIDRPDSLPQYLNSNPGKFGIDFIHGDLNSIADLKQYDLIQLSNIFDWMPTSEVQKIASKVDCQAKADTINVRFLKLSHH
jgi:S-adenosylmethionine-diacylglycerol 3-amino-3-carboxypropyl transferase